MTDDFHSLLHMGIKTAEQLDDNDMKVSLNMSNQKLLKLD
jgi:hypothetical protein